jgi:hypothetical protein
MPRTLHVSFHLRVPSFPYLLLLFFLSPHTQTLVIPTPRVLAQDANRGGAGVIEEPLAGRRVRVEEAVTRLFQLCRQIGGGDEVRDAVVAVPPYYTFGQRRLLAQILALAGLEPLVLINDLTAGTPHHPLPLVPVMLIHIVNAVAVDYASTREFPSR